MKNILVLAILFWTPYLSLAENIRRREESIQDAISLSPESNHEGARKFTPGATKKRMKGQKKAFSITDLTERLEKHRNLKKSRYGGYYAVYRNEDEMHYDEVDMYSKSKKKKRKYRQRREPKCRTVVEPVEFYMEAPIATIYVPNSQTMNLTNPSSGSTTGTGNNATATTATSTTTSSSASSGTTSVSMAEGDPQELGTRWIFNGPLLAFDEDAGLVDLDGFFASGVCTRTWLNMGDQGIPGANYCNLAFSMDTGAAILVSGEVFDGWDSNLGIEGGTREMLGVDGQITLTPLDDMLAPLDISKDVFEDSTWIRGRGSLIYEICPDRYWSRAYNNFQNLGSSSDEGTYPNPFDLEEN